MTSNSVPITHSYTTMSTESLETRLSDDLKTAMRAKDTLARDTIRGIKTALTMEKTSNSGGGLDEKKELAVLQRLKKQRTEAAEIFREQGRLDLAEPEEAQLAVIMTYLPEMMEGDALKAALQVIVDQIQPAGPQDFGRVMGAASKALSGKADNKQVAAMLKGMIS